MKIAFFDLHNFERKFFEEAQGKKHEINFIETRLTSKTAALAKGHQCVCSFVNDKLDSETVRLLAQEGIKLIALRSAGYNHVDIQACQKNGITLVRVPAYSPHAVAEHALALILSLNRKIHRAYQRVRELNFSLDGLVGFDLNGKTVGIVGTGNIGSVFLKIMHGLGCNILANDLIQNKELIENYQVNYVDLETILCKSDIISLHVPLTPETRHIINSTTLAKMKKGMMLINTGRGALIDTKALISALKSGQIGAAGLDVYEEEEGIFFMNLSDQMLNDDILARLLTFPQVLITSHQGFLTKEALTSIAKTTIKNISDFEDGLPLINEIKISSSIANN